MTETPTEKATFSSYLDRERDVLIVYGDPSPLHRDLELHSLACGVQHDTFVAETLRDGLTALALYLVSRPRFEAFGWTLSLQEPAVNLFFSGAARRATVVGRAFLENVQPATSNIFYSQVTRPHGEPQTSCVEVEGTNVFSIIEQFCDQSDQLPGRFFHKDERAALVVTFGERDREWLRCVEDNEVFGLGEGDELKLLSRTEVGFHCGCDRERMIQVVRTLYSTEPDELFQGDPGIEAECPRCGATHIVTRAEFDAEGDV